MKGSYLRTIQILIIIQDFFSAIGYSNYYLPDRQLGYKSYAIISVYYLRLNLAISNNKTQQTGALKR